MSLPHVNAGTVISIKATIQIYAYRISAARAPLDRYRARELQIENYYCNGDCVNYYLKRSLATWSKLCAYLCMLPKAIFDRFKGFFCHVFIAKGNLETFFRIHNRF